EAPPDHGETVQISSLALLKMLKHGRAGIPLEVMGLMLGSIVDDYLVRVDDVFAMPQTGRGDSVEDVDQLFQFDMLELLKQTGRQENAVGWYHSHPGFGPWLSAVDMNTQANFEKTGARTVAVVIDPVQSVKGRVVIDAFRLFPDHSLKTGAEPRQTTSNIGHLQRPSFVSMIHGCGRYYYSMPISYRRNELEEQMLLNLKRKDWTTGLRLRNHATAESENENRIRQTSDLMEEFNRRIQDECKQLAEKKSPKEIKTALSVKNVGKIDPKKRLEQCVTQAVEDTLSQSLTTMLFNAAF
ncbi:MAG: putative 26S proteasome non-ATPase regulatory subunit 14, partial [Streblomastix strix]